MQASIDERHLKGELKTSEESRRCSGSSSDQTLLSFFNVRVGMVMSFVYTPTSLV